MQIRYLLAAKDIRVAQSVADSTCRAEIKRPLWFRLLSGLVGISGAIAMAATLGMYQKYPAPITSDFSWVALPMAIMLFGAVALIRVAQTTVANSRLAQLSPFPIQQILSVDEAGVHIESRSGTCSLAWHAIKSIQEPHGYIAITTLQWVTFVIPESAFESIEQKADFKRLCQKNMSL